MKLAQIIDTVGVGTIIEVYCNDDRRYLFTNNYQSIIESLGDNYSEIMNKTVMFFKACKKNKIEVFMR